MRCLCTRLAQSRLATLKWLDMESGQHSNGQADKTIFNRILHLFNGSTVSDLEIMFYWQWWIVCCSSRFLVAHSASSNFWLSLREACWIGQRTGSVFRRHGWPKSFLWTKLFIKNVLILALALGAIWLVELMSLFHVGQLFPPIVRW